MDKFVYTRNTHSVNTRHAVNSNFRIPKLSTKTGQRSFSYRGVKTWNIIPTCIKTSTLSSFEKYVTNSLL